MFWPLLISLLTSAAPTTPSCFQRSDYKALKFKVFQQSDPLVLQPGSRDFPLSSPLYPATGVMTSNIKALNTTSPSGESGLVFAKSYLQSTNHCLFIPGVTPNVEACRNTSFLDGNYYPPPQPVEAYFSSYRKADACTKLQMWRVLGGDSGKIENDAKEAKLKLWDSRDRKSFEPQTIGSGKRGLVDVCILEDMAQAADAIGITLELSSGDGRTREQRLELLKAVRSMSRPYGKQLLVWAPTVPENEMHDLLLQTDVVIIPEAIAMRLKEPLEKVILATDVQDMKQAERLRNKILERHALGVLLLKPSERNCDSPLTQALACLTVGQCDGKFRR